MSNVADISVAIATRNRADSLARCLESLRAGQRVPAEVIVVDQSTDTATRDVVDAVQSEQMPIIYIHQLGSGLAKAQNAGFDAASQSIVAVTDDDCVVTAHWLSTIEQVFNACDNLTGVTGRVLPLEPEGEKTFAVSSRLRTERLDFAGKFLPWRIGSGNNFALKRDFYRRIGGCDERLGPGSPGQGGVDMDLFYRLMREGARIRFEPESLVYHERQTRTGRLARRPMYGRGMGACCAIWLREGDWYALRILASWFWLRTRLMAGGIRRGEWMPIYEELLMLGGTLQGLIYGFLLPTSVGQPAGTAQESPPN